MESLGAFADGDWDSLSRMFTDDDDLDFTSHFLGQGSSFPPQHNESLFHTLDFLNSNLQYLSQENSYSSSGSSGVFTTTPSQESYYFNDSYHHVPVANGVSMSLEVSVVDEKNIGSAINPAFTDIVMGESVCVEDKDAAGNDSQAAAATASGKQLQLKRMYDASSAELSTGAEDKANSDSSSPNVKKKARVSRDVQKSKKIVQSRKSQKVDRNGKEEESNTGVDGQSSSSYSSEDDNASQENNVGSTSETKAAVNSNGKTRASRGTATDPQSLYARKRRERINERLRILQNLVPNGTKVDISTMLEEAVHYVKFLQLQIKLLSSDDMWMYAPIAYNGMDIGLQQKISSLV